MGRIKKVATQFKNEISGYWWLQKDETLFIQRIIDILTDFCEIFPINLKKKFFVS